MCWVAGVGGAYNSCQAWVVQSVLITGCSRGIGLALAEELASRGWCVLAGAREPASARKLQEAARVVAPGRIDIISLDVCSDEGVSEAAKNAGDLDVLVNNAAVFPEEGRESLDELQLAHFAEAFATNVTGVARVTRAFLPNLVRAVHPRVVNISSRAGSVSEKEDSHYYCYSASKAALNMLTRTMAAELGLRRITVVAVTPGWVKTEMGGPNAVITAEESARSLAGMIEGLAPEDSGQFLERDGRRGVVAW